MNKDIKTYGAMGAAEAALSMAAPTGTISWFAVSDEVFPPKKTGHEFTERVLVYNKNRISTGYYEYDEKGWVADISPITHWAYINYPL